MNKRIFVKFITLIFTLGLAACGGGGGDSNPDSGTRAAYAVQGDIDLAQYLFPASSTTFSIDDYWVSEGTNDYLFTETETWDINGDTKTVTDSDGFSESMTVTADGIRYGYVNYYRFVDAGVIYDLYDDQDIDVNYSVTNTFASFQLNSGTGLTGDIYNDVIEITYTVIDKLSNPDQISYQIEYFARGVGYIGEYERHCYIYHDVYGYYIDDQPQPDAACEFIDYDYSIRQPVYVNNPGADPLPDPGSAFYTDISLNSPLNDTIPSYGTKVYRFQTAEAGDYTISLTNLASDLGWILVSYDPSDVSIIDLFNNPFIDDVNGDRYFSTAEEVFTETLSADTYYMIVVDEWDDSGDSRYTLQVIHY